MTPREIVMTTTGIIREEVEGEVTLVIETLIPEETDTDTLPPPNDVKIVIALHETIEENNNQSQKNPSIVVPLIMLTKRAK